MPTYVFRPTTWNPADKGSNCTLSNGNTTASGQQSNGSVRSVVAVVAGKWAWEATSTGSRNPIMGVATAAATLSDFPGNDAFGWSYYWLDSKKITGGVQTAYGTAPGSPSTVYRYELDADAGSLEVFRDNVSLGVAFTGLVGPLYVMTGGDTSSASNVTVNFGQTPFVNDPTAGFHEGFGEDVLLGEATVDVALPMLTLDAGFALELIGTLPMLTIDAGGGAEIIGTLPMLTLSAYFGAVSNLSMPMLALDAAGHDSTGENGFVGSLPMLTLNAWFGGVASVELPMLLLDGAMTGTALLSLDLALPMLRLDAGGIGSPWRANLDVTLPMLTLQADGGAGVDVVLPMFSIEAGVVGGSAGTLDGTLPMLRIEATVTLQTVARADLTLPMLQPVASAVLEIALPMLTLETVAHLVVTLEFEGYAVNLKHNSDKAPDEVTHYTNWPFTRIVRYQGRYIATAADGLYLLGGDTDGDDPTAWAFATHQTDFGSRLKKRVPEMVLAGELGHSAVVTAGGIHAQPEHRYASPRGPDGQNFRQKLSKKPNQAYWDFGIRDDNGGELYVDHLDFEVSESDQRSI